MIIGLDPGFGNTKVCADGAVYTLQSAVAEPRALGMAGAGIKTAQRLPLLRLADGREYVTGEGAWLWGQPLANTDFYDLASPARQALFFAALAGLLVPGRYDLELVVGLPVPLLQSETESQAAVEQIRRWKGGHAYQVDDQIYEVSISKIKILAQPVGAYADWLLTDDLRPRAGARDAEVAVLDIGLNTVDLYVVQGGQVAPRYIGGAKAGVRHLLAALNGRGHDVVEVDYALRRGSLRPTEAALDSWLAQILGVLENTWSDLRRFTTVIPAGGGSALLGQRLANVLTSRGAVVAWPDDPITTNVRGLYKWGAYAAR